MGLMDKLSSNIMQGLLGNLSEVTPEKLNQDYGMYLMDNENIHTGFILIRDIVIFTDKRIIDIDKQGATGKKARVTSIYLDSIVGVSAETAGFGFDDSEITVDFIASPYFRANSGVSIGSRKFEFPKKYQIQGLYKWLQEIAYENHIKLNQ